MAVIDETVVEIPPRSSSAAMKPAALRVLPVRLSKMTTALIALVLLQACRRSSRSPDVVEDAPGDVGAHRLGQPVAGVDLVERVARTGDVAAGGLGRGPSERGV